MSINADTNSGLYDECSAGDTERNETTPLLANVSVENCTVVVLSSENFNVIK